MSSALRTPPGQSQRTCRATVGQTPVNRWTWPASLNFSSVVVAAAGWIYFPKRVPVFAKPHEGSSMRKASSASKSLPVLCSFMWSLGNKAYNHFLARSRLFFGMESEGALQEDHAAFQFNECIYINNRADLGCFRHAGSLAMRISGEPSRHRRGFTSSVLAERQHRAQLDAIRL